MKNILLLVTMVNLAACSFGGFKPPIETQHWTSDEFIKHRSYSKKKREDMRACGIDPVAGYHTSAEQGLCMEAKGWYWTAGPVCNTLGFVDKPICVKWRVKRGLPYPSPEEIRRI